ncbi:hypothetical protein RCL1_006317 [Eukaryota sp. TZLM3-RCL]
MIYNVQKKSSNSTNPLFAAEIFQNLLIHSRMSFNSPIKQQFFEKGEDLPFGLGKAPDNLLLDVDTHKIVKKDLSDDELKEWRFRRSQDIQSLGFGRISPDVKKSLHEHGLL